MSFISTFHCFQRDLGSPSLLFSEGSLPTLDRNVLVKNLPLTGFWQVKVDTSRHFLFECYFFSSKLPTQILWALHFWSWFFVAAPPTYTWSLPLTLSFSFFMSPAADLFSNSLSTLQASSPYHACLISHLLTATLPLLPPLHLLR